MIEHRPMRSLKAELSDWLDEDVVKFIKRRHKNDGLTYTVIARELRESGFKVSEGTVSEWVRKSWREG
jgi:transposase-like protein